MKLKYSHNLIGAEILVFGKVQGVAFRYYTKLKAEELGISGTVKNKADGSVYIIAYGDTVIINKLIEWCEIGSPSSSVEKVVSEFIETENVDVSGFRILR